MIDKITNHIDRLKELLPGQFVGLPNWESMLTSYGTLVQDFEDELYRFFSELSLASAVGSQLDGLGEILGETRKGRSDSEYRAFLGIRVKINISRGEPETLIDVLAAITDSTYIGFVETFPAKVLLYFDGSVIPGDIISNINLIRPAGVMLELTASEGETPFVFDGDSTGLGFTGVTALDGGALSGAIT